MTCVDLAVVKACFNNLKGRRYRLGAKADQGGRALDCQAKDIPAIDCSGFTRWAVYKATQGSVVMPDGSQAQREWCAAHWKAKNYKDLHYAAQDTGRLFIAFLSPKPGADWPRHVWLVVAGETMEAAGGSMKSVGSRKWSEFKNVAACFEVPVC